MIERIDQSKQKFSSSALQTRLRFLHGIYFVHTSHICIKIRNSSCLVSETRTELHDAFRFATIEATFLDIHSILDESPIKFLFNFKYQFLNRRISTEIPDRESKKGIFSILRRSLLLIRGWLYLVIQYIRLMWTHLERHEIRWVAILSRWCLLLRLLLLMLQLLVLLLLRLDHRTYVTLRRSRHRWHWTDCQRMREQLCGHDWYWNGNR